MLFKSQSYKKALAKADRLEARDLASKNRLLNEQVREMLRKPFCTVSFIDKFISDSEKRMLLKFHMDEETKMLYIEFVQKEQEKTDL